jgi:hypothetical protein
MSLPLLLLEGSPSTLCIVGCVYSTACVESNEENIFRPSINLILILWLFSPQASHLTRWCAIRLWKSIFTPYHRKIKHNSCKSFLPDSKQQTFHLDCTSIIAFQFLPQVATSAFIASCRRYRTFHNVLQDNKNLWSENRRTHIYETCTDRRNSKMFFPESCFSL